MTDAERLIETYDLAPHPEGGWYRETWRGAAGPDGRACATAIYYLLKTGERSHWHRVDAAELWLHHAGGPLALELSPDGASIETIRLGTGPEAQPQGLVPKGCWQAARPLGDFALVSCVVAPGFSFEGFEMAPPGWRPQGAPA